METKALSNSIREWKRQLAEAQKQENDEWADECVENIEGLDKAVQALRALAALKAILKD